MDFSASLLNWYATSDPRPMPWKGEKDPYKIWLSEVILQQTRVEQGWDYYNKFVSRFPDVHALANADDQEVFKLWEGLGYYTRCRNLLASARMISQELNGTFPATYKDLLALKGVGPYTAAAIASFAFNIPVAVLDGNVFRVLARYFGKDTPIDTNEGKGLFSQLAEELLVKSAPATYNQAIMDFGAVVCKPQVPLCRACPLNAGCKAFELGIVNKLPVKEKKLTRSNRWFMYIIFKWNGKVLVNQRSEKDIWQGLYEFYLFESEAAFKWNTTAIQQWLSEQLGIRESKPATMSADYRQLLTHQVIHTRFISIELSILPTALSHMHQVDATALPTLAFPRSIRTYLDETAFQQVLF